MGGGLVLGLSETEDVVLVVEQAEGEPIEIVIKYVHGRKTSPRGEVRIEAPRSVAISRRQRFPEF